MGIMVWENAWPTFLKMLVLLIAAGAIYFFWIEQQALPPAGQGENAERITNTNVSVEIGAIEKRTLQRFVVGYGHVEPAPATEKMPAAEARISVPWPAIIKEVRCVEGQAVTEGQTLLVVELQPLGSLITVPTSGAGPKIIELKSPLNGIVTDLQIHAGEVASAGTPIVRIVDLDRLVLAATVPAWDASMLKVGQSATVQWPGGNGQATCQSTVVRVDPAISGETDLVGVDVEIPKNTSLRPGEFARVSIACEQQTDCLVVPADSVVQDSLDRPFIALVSSDQKQAVLKNVELGLRQDNWVQVIAPGLEEGQTVVTRGAFGLLSRTDISVIKS